MSEAWVVADLKIGSWVPLLRVRAIAILRSVYRADMDRKALRPYKEPKRAA